MVRNLAGQLVAETEARIEAGQNEFNVTSSQAGVFFITVATESGSVSYKAISTEPGGPDNTVSFRGSGSYAEIEISPPG